MKRLLFLAALALTGSCNRPNGAHGGMAAACEVALIYVEMTRTESRSDLPLLVVADDETGLDDLVALNRVPGEPKLPEPLLRKLQGKGGSALKACPGMRADLTRRGVPHALDGRQHPVKLRGENSYDTERLGVALPVLSDDGREALIATSTVNAPEGGMGQIVHLRRGFWGWSVVARRMVWIV